MAHSRKLLLFTLLITAALRSRLMSKCCFSAALCPGQSNMVLRIKRKWKMICSSDRSNSVSFLSVSLSPPCALPSGVTHAEGWWHLCAPSRAEQQGLPWGDCCIAGLTKLDMDLFCRTKSWVWLCENFSQRCSAAATSWCSAKVVAVPEES